MDETTSVVEAGGREVRQVPAGEFELRAADDGTLTLLGYAITYDQPYEFNHPRMGRISERMAAGSWARTIRNKADIRLMVNHDGIPLARTRSGTLRLTNDSHGVLVEARLDPASPRVQEVRSAMARGDLDQMSAAFVAVREKFDPEARSREILEVRGLDVSVVTYPANEATVAMIEEPRSDVAEDVEVVAEAPPAEVRRGMSLAQARAIAASLGSSLVA